MGRSTGKLLQPPFPVCTVNRQVEQPQSKRGLKLLRVEGLSHLPTRLTTLTRSSGKSTMGDRGGRWWVSVMASELTSYSNGKQWFFPASSFLKFSQKLQPSRTPEKLYLDWMNWVMEVSDSDWCKYWTLVDAIRLLLEFPLVDPCTHFTNAMNFVCS